MAIDPNALLDGPRGRRLCLEFARARSTPTESDDDFASAAFYAAHHLDPDRTRVTDGQARTGWPRPSPSEVASRLDAVDLDPPAAAGPDELLTLLSDVVAFAMYWQEPDGGDVLAATPELRRSLTRVAGRIAVAPGTRWWTAVAAPDEQSVIFCGCGARPPSTDTPVAERLARWRDSTVEGERRAAREHPVDPRAPLTGTWWSTPDEIVRTSHDLGAAGPAGLWLEEDICGRREATAVPVRVPSDPRIYEIDGPDAWARLCRHHPLEVSASRRHDWYRTTGRAGAWVIPDWSRVAEEFDGVHLTVAGYLSTAGRTVAVDGEVASVLAGWAPDETYWLADVTPDPDAGRPWRYDDEQGWTPDVNST